MKHTFNLSRWLSRLGVKGGDEPLITPSLQPVQVVGDASLLVPPLLPPTAAYGTTVGAVVGQHGAASIQSLAPGGTCIRQLGCGSWSNSVSWLWRVQAAAPTYAASNVLTAREMWPGMQSIVTAGSVIPANLPAGGVNDNPQFQTPNGFTFGVDDLIYIPTGSFFFIANTIVNAAALISLVLQDLPAAPGPE